MKEMLKRIQESKDVQIYQKLLKVLGDYSITTPATGIDSLFDTASGEGKKVLPKDKKALEILDYVLSCNSVPRCIHKLLNLRFSDLPVEYRPISKDGRKHRVCHWVRGAEISDRVKDLVDWKNTGKIGKWGDIEGEPVELIPLEKEEK